MNELTAAEKEWIEQGAIPAASGTVDLGVVTGGETDQPEPAYTEDPDVIGDPPAIDLDHEQTRSWILDAFERRLELTTADRKKLDAVLSKAIAGINNDQDQHAIAAHLVQAVIDAGVHESHRKELEQELIVAIGKANLSEPGQHTADLSEARYKATLAWYLRRKLGLPAEKPAHLVELETPTAPAGLSPEITGALEHWVKMGGKVADFADLGSSDLERIGIKEPLPHRRELYTWQIKRDWVASGGELGELDAEALADLMEVYDR